MDSHEQDVARILESLEPLPPACSLPALVVVSGLPGSGKSTVAHHLLQRVDAALLQSDRIRKTLVGQPDYSTEESARVFAAIHAAAERLLRGGVTVVLDATTLEERQRQPLVGIAERTGARLILVWVQAADREVRRRLAARHAGKRAAYDLSDAGVDVYEMMRARVEPIKRKHVTINTDRDYLPAVDALARTIRASC